MKTTLHMLTNFYNQTYNTCQLQYVKWSLWNKLVYSNTACVYIGIFAIRSFRWRMNND